MKQVFDKLTSSGRPVVIAVHAPLCNVFKAQGPIQTDLMKKPEYKDITKLTVDFDSQQNALKKFKVSTQSTMVVFKNAKEVARARVAQLAEQSAGQSRDNHKIRQVSDGNGSCSCLISMLNGSDKAVEIFLIEHSPGWLTSLTTRF